MAKKGKEFDLGGIRLQVDPFIIARRVLMRQKLLLASVAVLGMTLTVVLYKSTPKLYTSDATIAIRVDAMDENFVRTLMNRAMRDFNSDGEMMLMINELDLFGGTRVSLPYEMALRRMRAELQINQSTGSIGISYTAKEPPETQRVVAYASERVLAKIGNLLDSPFRREAEALDAAIAELEPKLKKAQKELYEFKADHPTIAISVPDFIPQDSPSAAIETKIKRAQDDLKSCYVSGSPLPKPKKSSAACLEAQAAKRRVDQLLEQFTPSHPQVIKEKQEYVILQKKCEADPNEASGDAPRKKMSQAECIAAANSEIRRLHEDKAQIQKVAIRKPELQQTWARLSSEASLLNSQYTALQDRRSKGEDERKVAANDFQENFTLVDPARVPEIPSSPDMGRFATLGMAVTALIGIALAALREALRQTFLSPTEFEEQTGLPVLAVLPDISDD